MSSALIQFASSALVIVLAGYFLTKCADAFAERTKLGKALVGSIFLAAATSLPELFVDINAIKNNQPDLAVGDLFGSSLFNLLILAIADLMHRNSKSMFSKSAQSHAISALMTINVTAIAGLAVLSGKYISQASVMDVSLPVFGVLLSYILCIRLIYSNQKMIVSSSEKHEADIMTLPKAIGGYLASTVILFITAPYLTHAAAVIADESGLGNTFVGTTLLAFCTSLPELVSTITAVRMGAFDLAIGNIFGSNSFNMILLVPLDFFFKGPLLAAVSQTHALTAMATIVTTSVAAMGQLYQVEKRIKLIEPDALVIIVITVGFLTFLYFI